MQSVAGGRAGPRRPATSTHESNTVHLISVLRTRLSLGSSVESSRTEESSRFIAAGDADDEEKWSGVESRIEARVPIRCGVLSAYYYE